MKKLTVITIIVVCVFMLQPAHESAADPVMISNLKNDLRLRQQQKRFDSLGAQIMNKLSHTKLVIVQAKNIIKQTLK